MLPIMLLILAHKKTIHVCTMHLATIHIAPIWTLPQEPAQLCSTKIRKNKL